MEMTKLIVGVNDQKKEWNEIWKGEKFINKLVSFGRKIYNLKWFMILKPYVDVKDFAEVGCGSSSLLIKISGCADNVVGIDYSNHALKVSREKFKKLGIKNVVFVNDNVLNLKIKKRFDSVWSQGLIEHFVDTSRIIKEHLKITRKNGYTIISCPYKFSYHYIWYKITRFKVLNSFWPWTEQDFLTKKSLRKILKVCCPCQTDFTVKVAWLFGVIILIIHKK